MIMHSNLSKMKSKILSTCLWDYTLYRLNEVIELRNFNIRLRNMACLGLNGFMTGFFLKKWVHCHGSSHFSQRELSGCLRIKHVISTSVVALLGTNP